MTIQSGMKKNQYVFKTTQLFLLFLRGYRIDLIYKKPEDKYFLNNTPIVACLLQRGINILLLFL